PRGARVDVYYLRRADLHQQLNLAHHEEHDRGQAVHVHAQLDEAAPRSEAEPGDRALEGLRRGDRREEDQDRDEQGRRDGGDPDLVALVLQALPEEEDEEERGIRKDGDQPGVGSHREALSPSEAPSYGCPGWPSERERAV